MPGLVPRERPRETARVSDSRCRQEAMLTETMAHTRIKAGTAPSASMKMKINSKDFRVPEGDEVDLKKWPTKVEPVYKSKEQYQEAPGRARRAAERAAAASLRIQPLCRPADLSGDGRGGKRRRHQARDVRGQPARLPGVQLQASQRRPNCSTIFSGAPRAICRNAGGSASSTDPITRKC